MLGVRPAVPRSRPEFARAGPGLIIAGHGSGTRASRYIAVRPGGAEAGAQTELAYELKDDIPLIPTPLIYGNRLFLWTDDGGVSCRRLDTGALVWKERVGGSYYASPVWVNHCLYNVAKNGQVVAVAAADNSKS